MDEKAQKLAALLNESGLQSASNGVADGVLGSTVDGTAWALRKLGLDIPSNPVGGSNWLQQQGFTREVPDTLPNAIGNGLGQAIGSAPYMPAQLSGLVKSLIK